jgi:hypothetical protein
MTLVYGPQLTSAKIITVLQIGDKLIRNDAFMFLKDLLPLWKGMWHQSTLEMPSSNDSATDHFVKQCSPNTIRNTIPRVVEYINRFLRI